MEKLRELSDADLEKVSLFIEWIKKHRGPAGDGADIGTAFPQLQAQAMLRHSLLTPQRCDPLTQIPFVLLNLKRRDRLFDERMIYFNYQKIASEQG